MMPALEADVLPAGIRSRFVDNVNGMRMHLLEAGAAEAPCLLLLHGFPELAYSWRKVMPALAAAGYHVVAPDQRGYGRTTGWDADYDSDVRSFGMLNLVRDVIGLVAALGPLSVTAIVGHDFGASVAAWCALLRPDIFPALVLMSAPFSGTPELEAAVNPDIHEALAALDRPRKHYQRYYSTRNANADMLECSQGLHAFLRGYYHIKSADWAGNQPFRLASWTAEALAQMPKYYIMDLERDMAQTVAQEMPSEAAIAACKWLPERELRVYCGEYERVGFQGGLQWYRCRTSGFDRAELQIFHGQGIRAPALFLAGAQDWGIYQAPDALERMQTNVCTDMRGCHLLSKAGHWVQQEAPAAVVVTLVAFLRDL